MTCPLFSLKPNKHNVSCPKSADPHYSPCVHILTPTALRLLGFATSIYTDS